MGIASSLGRLQVGCAVLNNRFDGNCSKREVNNERKGYYSEHLCLLLLVDDQEGQSQKQECI